jgi:hypothetical protein
MSIATITNIALSGLRQTPDSTDIKKNKVNGDVKFSDALQKAMRQKNISVISKKSTSSIAEYRRQGNVGGTNIATSNKDVPPKLVSEFMAGIYVDGMNSKGIADTEGNNNPIYDKHLRGVIVKSVTSQFNESFKDVSAK